MFAIKCLELYTGYERSRFGRLYSDCRTVGAALSTIRFGICGLSISALSSDPGVWALRIEELGLMALHLEDRDCKYYYYYYYFSCFAIN